MREGRQVAVFKVPPLLLSECHKEAHHAACCWHRHACWTKRQKGKEKCSKAKIHGRRRKACVEYRINGNSNGRSWENMPMRDKRGVVSPLAKGEEHGAA